MDDTEREELARRLSNMSFKAARKEIMRLDPDADLKTWRNSIWDEFHTLFTLPNAGLSIILIEKALRDSTDEEIAASPGDVMMRKVGFDYVGARVEPLEHRIKNSTGVP